MVRACPIWGALGLRHFALVSLASAMFVFAALLNAGFASSLYALSADMVSPAGGPSPYYVVITSYSVAPFTSVFRAGDVGERVSGIPGVEGVVYELLTPVVINSSVYVLRGLDPVGLEVSAGDYGVVGEGFRGDCIGCVWVGEGLAEELGLGINDTLVAGSPFASSDFVLRVAGVLKTGSVLRYELVTNTLTAEAVRGSGHGTASIAIVFADSPEAVKGVAEAFNISAAGVSVLERAFIALRLLGPKVRGFLTESLPSMYLSRFGIGRDAIAAVLAATAAALAAGLYLLGGTIIVHESPSLRLLWELGVPERVLRASTAALAEAFLLLGAGAAWAASATALPMIRFSVMGYATHPIPDPLMFAVSAAAASAMMLAGTAAARVGDEV